MNICPLVLEKKIFKGFRYVSLCQYLNPHWKPLLDPWTINFKIFKLHYMMMFSYKISEHWLSGSWGEDFLITPPYFHYFLIISPKKRARSLNFTILNPLYPRILCLKFGWNWSSGFWEEVENVKSLRRRWQQRRQRRRQTTDNFDQKSSPEPSAQVS